MEEGLRRAREAGLDLVEVAPDAKPPVCRVMNFGKYLYGLNKKEKEAKKKQKVIEVKEIKLTSKIGEHDYQTKLRSAIRFLSRGDKVKVRMFFRGREVTHADLGVKIIERFLTDLEDYGMVEKRTGLLGNNFLVLIAPKPTKSTSKKVGQQEET